MKIKIIDIKDINDLAKIEKAIINNEEFKIGEVSPIPFKLKFEGGRFENYNPDYIDKFIAEVVIVEQKNYDLLLKEIEKLYNIKIEDDKKILKFKLKKGSLEVLGELLGLSEVLKNMESIHLLYAILGIAGGWFSYLGFSKYLEKKKTELEIKSKEVLERLRGEEQERYLNTINKSIEALKEVSLDIKIQKAINEPKKKILNMLNDNEDVIINDDNEHKLTKDKIGEFEVIPPQKEDIEEEIVDIYLLKSYDFTDDKKTFKISGIPIKAISITMPAEKRLKIITKAENGESVKLKLKIIKDGVTKKIKEVYILDYIEE